MTQVLLNKKVSSKIKPLVQDQTYFIKNSINNEPIINSQSDCYQSKRLNSPKVTNGPAIKLDLQQIKTQSNSVLSSRRSYGTTLRQNYHNRVDLNNRCSIQNNAICSDVLLRNEDIRQKYLDQKRKQEQNYAEKLKKQPVNLKAYKEHLKKNQIIDAYYFVQKEVREADQRETNKKQTIKRVKSLSRGKSNEIGHKFRQNLKQQANCIQNLQTIKSTYQKTVVSQLMGSKSASKYQKLNQQRKKQMFQQASTLKSSFIQPQQNQKLNSKRLQNNFQKQFKKTSSTVNKFNIIENDLKDEQKYKKNFVQTKQTQNRTQKDKMMKILAKSKSLEDFIKKQRVKLIKQAFMQNWKQGPYEKQKIEKMFPCKHTLKVKKQKQQAKQQQILQNRKLMYGQTANKKNPICNDQQKFNFIQRLQSVKQYQSKFEWIGKNNIKSCVITKK